MRGWPVIFKVAISSEFLSVLLCGWQSSGEETIEEALTSHCLLLRTGLKGYFESCDAMKAHADGLDTAAGKSRPPMAAPSGRFQSALLSLGALHIQCGHIQVSLLRSHMHIFPLPFVVGCMMRCQDTGRSALRVESKGHWIN